MDNADNILKAIEKLNQTMTNGFEGMERRLDTLQGDITDIKDTLKGTNDTLGRVNSRCEGIQETSKSVLEILRGINESLE